MKITDIISSVNSEINIYERNIGRLQERKGSLEKLNERYPDAHMVGNDAIAIPNIWNEITCARLARQWNWPNGSIDIRFLLSKKQSPDKMKIFSYPYWNKIADIKPLVTTLGQRQRSYEITILDYTQIIPAECSKKKDFERRIKKYLISHIRYEKLSIANTSYNKELFEQYLSLV